MVSPTLKPSRRPTTTSILCAALRRFYPACQLLRFTLKRLLADIQAGEVDCVAVYKIDRLTRALMDFSKLVDLFDKHGVTFVSITQSFNTTSSMAG
jgi:DNA invertase Pin-like site-specific DNA recombinase